MRYPKVLASGDEAGDDWVVLQRVAGHAARAVLAGADASTSGAGPSSELADRPAGPARHAGAARTCRRPASRPSCCSRAPAPPTRCATALERAGHARPTSTPAPWPTPSGWVRALRTALDPFESTTLVHGDLHFQNVLWDGEHVTALLDLEFARAAPPDLDLDVLLRFCVVPFLFVPVGPGGGGQGRGLRRRAVLVPRRLPGAVRPPRGCSTGCASTPSRFDVRDLLANPPTRPAQRAHARTTRTAASLATLRGQGHLDYLAARSRLSGRLSSTCRAAPAVEWRGGASGPAVTAGSRPRAVGRTCSR